MELLQGFFLLIMGVGVLAVDYQSLAKGWLPCGPDGHGGLQKFFREEQPFLYWLMFGVFGILGLVMIVLSMRMFMGDMEALPLS